MNALGIHFGHDAAIARITDNDFMYISLERVTGVRHALGINTEYLLNYLNEDVQSIVIGSTQRIPIFYDKEKLTITIPESELIFGRDWFNRFDPNVTHHYRKYSGWSEGCILDYQGALVLENTFPYYHPAYDGSCESFSKMSMIRAVEDLNPSHHFLKLGKVTIKNKSHALHYCQHHYLHAQYAASINQFKPSIIVTGDAGVGHDYRAGGIYFFDPKTGLRPIIPASGWVGSFYNLIARKVGLGNGAAGKLMGLSSYGKPIYMDDALVGTLDEISQSNTKNLLYRVEECIERWFLRHPDLGGNITKEWDIKSQEAPPRFIADIAATAQLVVEINRLKLVDIAVQIAQRSGFMYDNIILAGGVALNCPSNTLIYLKYPNTLVPPAANDEGIAIGAAILAWYRLVKQWPTIDFSVPYMGYALENKFMDEQAKEYGFKKIDTEFYSVAIDLLKTGKVLSVAHGKSEVGPRALGHRSLIADPTNLNSWQKVNQCKGREPWRPFAPVVLESEFGKYFDSGPPISKYMLFTHRVKNKLLPAITHYDHSARVQTVRADDQATVFFNLLSQLQIKGHIPVLLNTSLNGPGQPIAETEVDVFAISKKLDVAAVLTDKAIYLKE